MSETNSSESPSPRPKDGQEIIDDYDNGRLVKLGEALLIDAEEVEKAKKAWALGSEASVAYLLGEA